MTVEGSFWDELTESSQLLEKLIERLSMAERLSQHVEPRNPDIKGELPEMLSDLRRIREYILREIG
jgi:hypothetical protein